MAGRHGRLGTLSPFEKETVDQLSFQTDGDLKNIILSHWPTPEAVRNVNQSPEHGDARGGGKSCPNKSPASTTKLKSSRRPSLGFDSDNSPLTPKTKKSTVGAVKCNAFGGEHLRGNSFGRQGTNNTQLMHATGQEQQLLAEPQGLGTGCLNCGADDDHSNLLLCEACNDEYHTYCLDPPLRSVPEGDFFCDKCKPFHIHAQADDGLIESVLTLPPAFTSRFGEIVWAAGGVGFGWWPACIYDPRLTVGAARSLAQSNLGKKHLVYFFECYDAPFTVLGNSKLMSWREGLIEEFDLGRTAKAAGKNKILLFEKALQAALVEVEKPMYMRMELNHSKEMPLAPQLQTRTVGKRASPFQDSVSIRKKQKKLSEEDKRPSPLQDNVSIRKKQKKISEEDKLTKKTSSTRSGRKSLKPLPTDFVGSNAEYRALSAAIALSKAEAEENAQKQQDQEHDGKQVHTVSKRTNFNAAIQALSPSVKSAIQIEPAEDGQMFCKILQKISLTQRVASVGDFSPPMLTTINVGFITLPSRKKSNFADARRAMTSDLDNDCLPMNSWKFYVPKLGPVSVKQEGKLGPMLNFLLQTTSDKRLGDGTSRNPLKVIMMELNPQGKNDTKQTQHNHQL